MVKGIGLTTHDCVMFVVLYTKINADCDNLQTVVSGTKFTLATTLVTSDRHALYHLILSPEVATKYAYAYFGDT